MTEPKQYDTLRRSRSSQRCSPIMASSGDPERDEKRLFLPHRMP